VGDLCVRKVETAAPRQLAREAARRMAERAVGTLVVVDELGRPLGIVTDRDLMVRCIAEPADLKRTRVGRVMSGPVAWIHQDAPAEAALEEMARLRVRRLAVVDERERLVGLLALDDLLCLELGSGSALGRVLRRTMA
jgi:CBS domain-containing protein